MLLLKINIYVFNFFVLFSKDRTVSVWLDNSPSPQVVFSERLISKSQNISHNSSLETAATRPRPPCPGCHCGHRLAAVASLLLLSAITSARTPGFFSVRWKDKKEHVEK